MSRKRSKSDDGSRVHSKILRSARDVSVKNATSAQTERPLAGKDMASVDQEDSDAEDLDFSDHDSADLDLETDPVDETDKLQDFMGNGLLQPEEPDDVEQELKRLVFGDDVGFRLGLQSFQSKRQPLPIVAEEEKNALAGLDGPDYFVMDTTGSMPHDSVRDQDDSQTEEDDFAQAGHKAAWDDSDDERLAVSLASVPMLRKLRKTEAEDVVSGTEYIKRLRKRYELLHPRPEWAVEAMQRPHKRPRLSENNESEDAESSSDDMDNSAAPLAQLLRSSGSLVKRSSSLPNGKRKLRPEVLDIQRARDIEGVQPSAITSLSFHPEYPFLLSSGPSSTLYLHHISPSPPAPVPDPLLTSLHVKGAALTTTAFHPKDSRIFLSARRRYFHIWNLETGRVEKIARVYGQQHEQRTMERFKLSPDGSSMALLASARKGGGTLNILDAHTLQWQSQARIESRGGIADFAWWSSSKGLTIVGKNGEVTEWDASDNSVVARWRDQGAVGTTVLALGGHNGHAKGSAIGTDRWVAIGSSSGIVNIYDRKAWLSSSSSASCVIIPLDPVPTRVLDNLTTPVSNLVFCPDGQMLLMSSRWKKDALRLVHLPSCTVFKNWPTSKTPLGRVTGAAFGPTTRAATAADSSSSGAAEVLAVANEAGKIRLWEIRA